MRMHRRVTVFAAAFMAVMVGGAALAAVGVIAPPSTSAPQAVSAAALPTPVLAEALVTDVVIQHEPTDIRPDYEFTAHQRYEIVDEDPATNGYWGTSKPGSLVVVESRFGAGRTETNDDGHWELKVEFNDMPCNECFKVVASSGDHQQAFEMKRACRVDVEFTAHQQYGECREDTPYDVFWGTAAPGADIKVDSPYGSGSTTANDDGHWELKVEFPTAPAGKKFEVSVTSSDGGSAGFGFVYLAPDEPTHEV